MPVLTRRLLQLAVGLVLYGASNALVILAALGNDPWDVLHQGLARQTGIGIGPWVCIVGALVLLLWIPLRQRPGLGTVSNVFVVGLAAGVTLHTVPAPHDTLVRWLVLIVGVGLNGIATGAYIGARFGAGPRDGLMTALAARGLSVRVVRTGIEVAVLAVGAVLGGTVGVGTVLYAAAIGPLVHVLLPWFTVPAAVSADA